MLGQQLDGDEALQPVLGRGEREDIAVLDRLQRRGLEVAPSHHEVLAHLLLDLGQRHRVKVAWSQVGEGVGVLLDLGGPRRQVLDRAPLAVERSHDLHAGPLLAQDLEHAGDPLVQHREPGERVADHDLSVRPAGDALEHLQGQHLPDLEVAVADEQVHAAAGRRRRVDGDQRDAGRGGLLQGLDEGVGRQRLKRDAVLRDLEGGLEEARLRLAVRPGAGRGDLGAEPQPWPPGPSPAWRSAPWSSRRRRCSRA